MNDVTSTITCTLVPERSRLKFLPAYFNGGGASFMVLEHTVYGLASEQLADYHGGMWDFFELSNGGAFMSPQSPARVSVSVDGNGFEGEMSTQAAGICVTLAALSHLAFQYPQWAQLFSDRFHQLREFALDHAEAGLIFSAID